MLERGPTGIKLLDNKDPPPNGRSPAAPPDKERKPLRVQRAVGQPCELLLFHTPTGLAEHPADGHLQVDAGVATRQVPNPADLVGVEHPGHSAAGAARRFFPRRWSRRTRAFASPKTPRTVARWRNPGKRYASASRRTVRIRQSWHIFSEEKTHTTLVQQRFRAISYSISPTRFGEDSFF